MKFSFLILLVTKLKIHKLDGNLWIYIYPVQFSCSVVSDSLRPVNHSTPGLPVHHQLPEFTQTHVHWVGNAIQASHPLLSPSPPALNLSQRQDLVQWVGSSHQVAKVLEFQLQHHPTSEHPGLISFRMDWLDLLAVQGTFKSLLQHHSSKASILQCSVFFIVQLSHPYMTTGKTIVLIRRTFIDKVMSLLFNMLTRLIITFLPGSQSVNSVAQSCPTLCDPHESQHSRAPCPSPTPGVYSNSCPSSQWCHPAISSSVIPFSSCLQWVSVF